MINVTGIRVLGVLPCLSRAGLGHIFIVGYRYKYSYIWWFIQHQPYVV
jgi:hypothetical protein